MKIKFKEGQIWGTTYFKTLAITKISNDKIHSIGQDGTVMLDDKKVFDKAVKFNDITLMSKYDTWQEAVNSKEFKGE